MNILDYLVGNTDRHPEYWGFRIDECVCETNQPVSLHPLMDFNMSFQRYNKLDEANCQTVIPRKLTQREAAIEAVKAIGLRRIRDVDPSTGNGGIGFKFPGQKALRQCAVREHTDSIFLAIWQKIPLIIPPQ